MKLRDQIAHVVVHGPAAPRLLRRRSARWLAVYAGLACAVLGSVAAGVIRHREDLRGLLLGYLLPADWHGAAAVVIDNFLAAQTRDVLINAVLGGTLLLISVLLFPVRERLSATYEREAGLAPDDGREFPLWFQALEEGKLVVLYLTAQMTIFWVGYGPDPGRRALATALSYLYLFASYGIDFIAPVLQRRRLRYSQVIRALGARPVLLLGFGAVFAVLPVAVGRALAARPEVPLEQAIAALFAAHLVTLVWAVLAGTRTGAALLPAARATPPVGGPVRALSWTALLAAFGANAYAFGAMGLAVHHKSQILKCEWSVDWRTFELERPALGGLLFGVVDLGLRFAVEVRNPTPFDVVIEDNRLEIRHDGRLVAQSSLSPMAVPAGAHRRQAVDTRLRLRAATLLEGRELLEDRWSVTLFVEVAPGMELPVYLRAAPAT